MARPPRDRSPRVLAAAAALAVLLLLLAILWPRSPKLAAPASGAAAEPASAAATAPSPADAQAARRQAPAQAKPPAPASPAPQQRADAPDGGVALFGQMVTLGQNLVLATALAKNAANADAYVDRLCEAHRRLSERPPLQEPKTRERDAAAYMAPLIDYEAPLNDPPGKLHVSDALRARMQSLGLDAMLRLTEDDLKGFDFRWMQDLAQFDHWTMLGAGRLKDHPAGDFYTDPIPNYLSLMVWVKLRFALALKRGDVAAASAEVRHLADLIQSQGSLIGAATAVAIYNLDARAREMAAGSGLDLGGWPEPDRPGLQRYRELAFASMYFTYPGVSEATLRKAAGCMTAPCAALLEGIGATRTFSAYAATNNLPVIEELFAANRCEAALLARHAVGRELPAGEALQQVGDEIEHQIPKLLDSGH